MAAKFSCSSARALALVGALVVLLVGLQPAKAADDPYSNQQWDMVQIHAQAAWSVSTGGGVKIGIVDSGVNRNHEDLAGRVADAATCIGTGGNPSGCTTGPGAGDDIYGHGTHVAGVAVANAGNGKGIAGVAPTAQLVVARVFSPGKQEGDDPTANVDDVKAGIQWVVQHGARVVNLSFGADSPGFNLCSVTSSCESPLRGAVEDAWNAGALPIIAAGNSDPYGSGGYGNIDAIVVGATTPSDTVASYSTTISNAKWGILAPGGETPSNPSTPTEADRAKLVLSSFAGSRCDPASNPSCYAYLAGTSMAAPHVSAAAALLFDKGLSRQAVIDTLLSTGDDVRCDNNTRTCPRLNVAAAVGATTRVDNGGSSTTPTTKKPRNATVTTTTAPPVGSGGTTPTTSFGFGGSTAATIGAGNRVTNAPPPTSSALLLNQASKNNAVPVWLSFAGVASLAFAALAMSYNLRSTLTTLP